MSADNFVKVEHGEIQWQVTGRWAVLLALILWLVPAAIGFALGAWLW